MDTINTTNDLVTQLVKAFQARDDMQLANLKEAAFLADLEKTALEKEQARLAKKYGAHSAQASAAAARFTLLGQENDALAADIARASMPVPATEAGTFVVYGKISDAQGKGLSGLKVTATDAKGAALASGSSKAQGLFEVRVPVTPQNQTAGKEAEAAKKVAETARKEGAAAAMPPQPPVSFQLVITGSKLQQPYTSPETIAATPGRLAYREITLPETPQRSGDEQTKAKKK